jgi:hypothetical protein
MKKAEGDNKILNTTATMALGQFPAVDNISD